MNLSAYEDTETAFKNWNKWNTYLLAFHYMDAKKLRLLDIQKIAEKYGIKASVIKTRRVQYLQYKKKLNFDYIKYHSKTATEVTQ
tara:strand:+ start:918 stop:1172 length:255 start_codon:yes stop_codon:yes gene_type:complete